LISILIVVCGSRLVLRLLTAPNLLYLGGAVPAGRREDDVSSPRPEMRLADVRALGRPIWSP
jgi:hypothetical protein